MTSEWSFTQGGPEEDLRNEFKVGQHFRNKEEVMLAVKTYNIKRAVEYKIVCSDQCRYSAQCIQFGPGCNWSIHISYRRKVEKWEVRIYTGPPKCMQTSIGQDHCRLDSKMISQHIFTMVKTYPTISIRVLQGGVENHFGYKVSNRKVWLAKQIVIVSIYRDWKESYNELPRWLFAMQMYLPGTWVQLVTQPWLGSADFVMFHRDGNANILPIAFAVVEGEINEAWSFFLSYLRQHVTPQPGVLVISDKHKSIDGKLNANDSLWRPPHAFQLFCTRYIVANFITHFKNKNLKKVLINAVYLKSQREFPHYFGYLRGENEAITRWLEEMPSSQ
ncbi:uncharacterized protein LOC127748426 [Arachis duranensis]|uniref:Uncharacterized protein LOC127748426 n=1 Tax=Arachis duranensis TaxID=130453 RepID=A0A9C6TZX7_ARADU|nr:uncharacterized protein LOC127748426 [Arachis duranensis]